MNFEFFCFSRERRWEKWSDNDCFLLVQSDIKMLKNSELFLQSWSMLPSPNDDEKKVISQPELIKLYLISLPKYRYCLTFDATQATHYALIPASLSDCLEFYIGQSFTASELHSRLKFKAIKRISPKKLFLERELEGLLEFGVRYEKADLHWLVFKKSNHQS